MSTSSLGNSVRPAAQWLSRLVRRSPLALLVSILTLALGVGAATAIFAVVHAVLVRPLDLREPDSLVQLIALNRQNGGRETGFSLPELRDWQERTQTFAAVRLFG